MTGTKETISPRGEEAHALFCRVQDDICTALGEADGDVEFQTDNWDREGGGGGGCTRIASEGAVIEKGGVNVSCVHGELSPEFAKELPGQAKSFFATGVSLVIHPRSPRVPTVHANFRYIETHGDETKAWYGGGADLTPWILEPEDAVHFHKVWSDVCGRHSDVKYSALKKWCDEYFYLKHRKETRGVGGIFYDYLGLPDKAGKAMDLDKAFSFATDAATHFIEAYVPILDRRKEEPHTEEERHWQLVRRGRYVEFNLLYDRGTVFGLKTNGRVESILMSLPNVVRWDYNRSPQAGTYQEELVNVLKSPRDWLGG